MRKLSIITVCYHSGSKLTETVKTVFQQTYTDWEIVIKDAGSTDGSLQELQTFLETADAGKAAQVRVISQGDAGIYDGMNQATKEAQGEYFYFLNCGDRLPEATTLETFMKGVEEQPGSLIYYGDVCDMLRRSRVKSNPHMDAFGCYRHVPCHQACVYHRSLFEERGYRTEYKIRADYEHFLWCFFEKKANPKYIDVVLSEYEGGGFSETKENRALSAKEHKEIVAQYMSKGQLFKYRSVMLLTLQPLRTWMAENPYLGKWYQKFKKLLYR